MIKAAGASGVAAPAEELAAPPLVSGQWLAARLGQGDIRVLDASWYLPQMARDAKAEYAAGHIPGAVFFDVDAIVDRQSALPHAMPSAPEFQAAVEALGVSNSDQVVIYDGSGCNLSAARAWWMFRTFGHDRAAVLDGGMKKWQAEGRALEVAIPNPKPGRFAPRFRSELLRDYARMRQNASRPREIVVDARSAARFEGSAPEPRPGVKSGHIPGSINLPYDSLVSPLSGEYLPLKEIESKLRRLGIDPKQPIVASCGSGLSACSVLLTLHRLGAKNIALYDGSWADWGSRAESRIEVGESLVSARPRPRSDGKLDVTLLQLESITRIAQPPPPPSAAALGLKKAERPAIAFYREMYHAVGGDWGWVDRKRLNDVELALIIHHPQIEMQVFYVGDARAGYAEIDWRAMPEVTLAYFGLRSEFHGHGLGEYFLRSVLAMIWAKGASKIHISTQNTEHPGAWPLYRKVGFEIVDTKQIVVDLKV